MAIRYHLKKGDYIICDPAILVKKTKDGDAWVKKLWDVFYQDMNHFHELFIEGVHLYITRTAEGDGFFGEIGTDTGTLAVFDIETIKNDQRFHHAYDRRGAKIFQADDTFFVEVENYNIYLSNGYKVLTQD